MSRWRSLPWPASALFVIASTAHADIALTPAQQENLGVQTAAATQTAAAMQLPAVARVIDPLPWIKLEADWRAASAAAQAARREAERARRLHAADSSVSGRALETADSQAAADGARRESLDAERRLTMGAALTDMADAARQQLFADLAQGRARLLRFEAVGDADDDVSCNGASLDRGAMRIEWLGPAPQANAANLARGWLGIARGLDAVPGEAMAARLVSPRSQDGIRVPETAVLRWNAATWVYRQQPDASYVRIAVALLRRLDDGNWLAGGVQPGDAIVVAGAQALLSADLGEH